MTTLLQETASPLAGGAAPWVYDDGGRAAAGYRGVTGDCVARAVAIATGRPYQEVYDRINTLARQHERLTRRRPKHSSARTGVRKVTTSRVMAEYGGVWTPTMSIGSGCTVHVRTSELPTGRLVLNLSGHVAAFIDGVTHDTHDPSRSGTRCVYGFWTFPERTTA